jgi:hypothetical protein
VKWFCIVLIGATCASTLSGAELEHSTPSFKYERYDADGGALFKSRGKNSYVNNLVTAVLVDSKARVWVSTSTGLALYDGKVWSSRTFKPVGMATRATLALFGATDTGPDLIAEGPAGTIWLGGAFGIWRHQNGRYDEVNSEISLPIGMAVDQSGALWVVTRYDAQRYDGKSWTTVLCPYFAGSIHRELSGLTSIAIDTNGSVWIGGRVFIEPTEPWIHEGLIWTVDQSRKRRGGGPPMAPMFRFDGKSWRAFSRADGLHTEKQEWAVPKVDGLGRVIAKTFDHYYVFEGEKWRRGNEADVSLGKRWVLRGRKKGFLRGYSDLLFRDGEKLVEVRAVDHKTGKVLDVQSEQLVSLHLAEDTNRNCIWLGTDDGLYRIWREKENR